jgi:hypothetical protein
MVIVLVVDCFSGVSGEKNKHFKYNPFVQLSLSDMIGLFCFPYLLLFFFHLETLPLLWSIVCVLWFLLIMFIIIITCSLSLHQYKLMCESMQPEQISFLTKSCMTEEEMKKFT